ncbi:MAG: FtsQ-type POTRA domain-containing protein [Limnothrix sp.]
MTHPVSIARDDLRKRRKQKQRQRSILWAQGLWRSLVLIGLASGAVWLTTRPEWILYSSEQITIKGNDTLSASTIRSIIPLGYPQSLLSLKPQNLEQAIEDQGAIAEAIVTRHLLPPSLSIQVEERLPVGRSFAPIAPSRNNQSMELGYLDEQGNWFPDSAYQNVTAEINFPELEVVGIREIQLPQWRAIYPLLRRSPVKIISVDWQDSNNLKLQTEIGLFHLGGNLDLLQAQLTTISQLAAIDRTMLPSTIDYIDLSNPAEPIIKTKKNNKATPDSETIN